jgi:hypothetical protein
MVRGQQAKVETPGSNQKRYLSGSLNWPKRMAGIGPGRTGAEPK